MQSPLTSHSVQFELMCRQSRRLCWLRLLLPLLVTLFALALAVDGEAVAATAPLLGAFILRRYLDTVDPAGRLLRGTSLGWLGAGNRPVELRCLARSDGLLWLVMRVAGGPAQSLLLFRDAVDEQQWRRLRRRLTLQAPGNAS